MAPCYKSQKLASSACCQVILIAARAAIAHPNILPPTITCESQIIHLRHTIHTYPSIVLGTWPFSPSCRDTISEGIEGKQADLFEEIGVDTDEAAGVTYSLFEKLVPVGGAIKRSKSGRAA